VHTDLVVDLSTGAATATLTIAGSATSTGLSLEVGSLDIVSVSALDGALDWTAAAGQLDVGLSTGGDVVVVVDYILSIGNPATGGLLANGSTRTWPVFCGELFPCHSDPADGITYSLDIQGTPRGQGTVYVSSVDTSAPSYMLAWATEDFVTTTLGTTAGGTKLEAHLLGPMSPAVAANSAVVVEAFGWLETHIGPYAFGTRAGAVEVAYPAPVWIGGMEHHPYWHLDTGSTEDPVTMVHEAVHGWYGNGVRMACWEDFVLSEGTVSYLTAVSMGAILGAEYESNVWAYYNFRLSIDPATDTTVAWPDGCGEVDPVEGYTSVPYYKGALFFLAVEAEIGRGSLVAALGSFYQQHVGEAAGMADLLDHIQSETGFDPSALATLWLQSVG
jgi:aminopeptidase N